MVKEAYCSYEVAKLLKEKGFYSSFCKTYYTTEVKSLTPLYTIIVIDEDEENIILAPTHQMALTWLREEYDIIVVIEPHDYNYIDSKTSSYVFSLWCGDNYEEPYSNQGSGIYGISYKSYEYAVDTALKYVLENLI